MFDRPKYKKFAKIQLKGRWGVPVLITIITLIITGLFDLPELIKFYTSSALSDFITSPLSQNSLQNFYMEISTASSTTTDLLLSIIQIIISTILDVAAINVWLQMTRTPQKVSFSAFIEGFNNWARATLGALWQFFWVFVWSLLFIIPGIVKAFSYSQMFYIIAEYDNVSVTKAMRISTIITKGHRWELFVMALTFIGWALLCTLTLGIGLIFLQPYMNLSFVNAYHGMMKEAIEQGKIHPEDLA